MFKVKRSALLMGLLMIFLIPACTKDTTVYIKSGEEVTTPVSFSKEIIPIFNKSCNTSGCHNKGGIKPDLSEQNAYTSLTNGGYYNVSDPSSSLLYLWLTGKKTPAMPIGAANNPSNINGLTLAWITQGAKNN
jgi:hypothetical protein